MENNALDARLRVIQDAPLNGKIVLLRVDHNVVKKGKITDPYRIDATIPTLYYLAARGAKPVLMTHVGRPRDKKTGHITCRDGESIAPIVKYLSEKLPVDIHEPHFPIDPKKGIIQMDGAMDSALDALRAGKTDMIYLPNIRWFNGEEAKGQKRDALAGSLAAMGDLYVNDAFGSWRAHASTYDIATRLPSYAGLLLQKELHTLHRVLDPQRPFVAVVAGAKYDTKIGPLKALHEKVDHLILGGIMYNTFLSAKYDLPIEGVPESDKALAMELVELDRAEQKIIEMPYVVESDHPDRREDGAYRSLQLDELKKRESVKFLLDVDPRSMDTPQVREAIGSAKTVFINAVMGMMPQFPEGSKAVYEAIAANTEAIKLFAGGDTLQVFKELCPGPYMTGLEDPGSYYFTGGGSVLSAIEQGTPYGLEPVGVLMEDAQ
ncbi:MAG: phosphoglycerate kinase [Deltaproteobacteria bacterium]|nr:phosphoglycerate kinase [Deltaproteobacteria bacterium]